MDSCRTGEPEEAAWKGLTTTRRHGRWVELFRRMTKAGQMSGDPGRGLPDSGETGDGALASSGEASQLGCRWEASRFEAS